MSGDTITGHLELSGHPARDEHAVNKGHLDKTLGSYVSRKTPLVSPFIDMRFYDGRHTYFNRTDGSVKSVSGLEGTWDKRYPLVKHVDSDGVKCLRARVSGNLGSCMFFLCLPLKHLGCAVFLCTRLDTFKSPSRAVGLSVCERIWLVRPLYKL